MGEAQGFRVMRNKHGWFAVPPGRIDLEASPVGHGDTAEAAIRDLLTDPRFHALAKLHAWKNVHSSDFIIDSAPAHADLAERARMKQRISGGQ
jgi:hypothetical protein